MSLNRLLVLDTGPLGRIAHPNASGDTLQKLSTLDSMGAGLLISEIVDYEVRRSLILNDLTTSIARLDGLVGLATYLPVNTSHMRKAAELWALCRKAHRPNADPKSLDADVIIAAQTLAVNGILVTDNTDDFHLLVETIKWSEI